MSYDDEDEIESDDIESEDEAEGEENWGVVVQRFGSRAEALAACSALQAVGIFPEVVSENPVSDTIMPASGEGSYALLVAEEDVEKASGVLENAAQIAPDTAPDPGEDSGGA